MYYKQRLPNLCWVDLIINAVQRKNDMKKPQSRSEMLLQAPQVQQYPKPRQDLHAPIFQGGAQSTPTQNPSPPQQDPWQGPQQAPAPAPMPQPQPWHPPQPPQPKPMPDPRLNDEGQFSGKIPNQPQVPYYDQKILFDNIGGQLHNSIQSGANLNQTVNKFMTDTRDWNKERPEIIDKFMGYLKEHRDYNYIPDYIAPQIHINEELEDERRKQIAELESNKHINFRKELEKDLQGIILGDRPINHPENSWNNTRDYMDAMQRWDNQKYSASYPIDTELLKPIFQGLKGYNKDEQKLLKNIKDYTLAPLNMAHQKRVPKEYREYFDRAYFSIDPETNEVKLNERLLPLDPIYNNNHALGLKENLYFQKELVDTLSKLWQEGFKPSTSETPDSGDTGTVEEPEDIKYFPLKQKEQPEFFARQIAQELRQFGEERGLYEYDIDQPPKTWDQEALQNVVSSEPFLGLMNSILHMGADDMEDAAQKALKVLSDVTLPSLNQDLILRGKEMFEPLINTFWKQYQEDPEGMSRKLQEVASMTILPEKQTLTPQEEFDIIQKDYKKYMMQEQERQGVDKILEEILEEYKESGDSSQLKDLADEINQQLIGAQDYRKITETFVPSGDFLKDFLSSRGHDKDYIREGTQAFLSDLASSPQVLKDMKDNKNFKEIVDKIHEHTPENPIVQEELSRIQDEIAQGESLVEEIFAPDEEDESDEGGLLGDILAGLGSAASGLASGVASGVGSVANKVADTASQAASSAVNKVTDTASNAANKVYDTGSGLVNNLINAVSQIPDNIDKDIKKAQAIVNAIGWVGSTARRMIFQAGSAIANEMLKSAQNGPTHINNDIKKAQKIIDTLQWMGGYIPVSLPIIGGAVDKVIDTMREADYSGLRTGGNMMLEGGGIALEGLGSVYEYIKDQVKTIVAEQLKDVEITQDELNEVVDTVLDHDDVQKAIMDEIKQKKPEISEVTEATETPEDTRTQELAERQEAERKAQELEERQEAERKAQEPTDRQQAERKEQEPTDRQQAERKEQELAERQEAERKAQELAIKQAQRHAERQEAERKAQELAERQEAERKAQELAERQEAERKAQELAERQEAERKAQELAERQEAERKAQELAERKAQELAERQEAERKAQELAEKQEAERKAQELAERQEAERKAQELAKSQLEMQEAESKKLQEEVKKQLSQLLEDLAKMPWTDAQGFGARVQRINDDIRKINTAYGRNIGFPLQEKLIKQTGAFYKQQEKIFYDILGSKGDQDLQDNMNKWLQYNGQEPINALNAQQLKGLKSRLTDEELNSLATSKYLDQLEERIKDIQFGIPSDVLSSFEDAGKFGEAGALIPVLQDMFNKKNFNKNSAALSKQLVERLSKIPANQLTKEELDERRQIIELYQGNILDDPYLNPKYNLENVKTNLPKLIDKYGGATLIESAREEDRKEIMKLIADGMTKQQKRAVAQSISILQQLSEPTDKVERVQRDKDVLNAWKQLLNNGQALFPKSVASELSKSIDEELEIINTSEDAYNDFTKTTKDDLESVLSQIKDTNAQKDISDGFIKSLTKDEGNLKEQLEAPAVKQLITPKTLDVPTGQAQGKLVQQGYTMTHPTINDKASILALKERWQDFNIQFSGSSPYPRRLEVNNRVRKFRPSKKNKGEFEVESYPVPSGGRGVGRGADVVTLPRLRFGGVNLSPFTFTYPWDEQSGDFVKKSQNNGLTHDTHTPLSLNNYLDGQKAWSPTEPRPYVRAYSTGSKTHSKWLDEGMLPPQSKFTMADHLPDMLMTAQNLLDGIEALGVFRGKISDENSNGKLNELYKSAGRIFAGLEPETWDYYKENNLGARIEELADIRDDMFSIIKGRQDKIADEIDTLQEQLRKMDANDKEAIAKIEEKLNDKGRALFKASREGVFSNIPDNSMFIYIPDGAQTERLEQNFDLRTTSLYDNLRDNGRGRYAIGTPKADLMKSVNGFDWVNDVEHGGTEINKLSDSDKINSVR